MVQMNLFAGQKLRHSCRDQTYGHQGGKVVGVGSGNAEEKKKKQIKKNTSNASSLPTGMFIPQILKTHPIVS